MVTPKFKFGDRVLVQLHVNGILRQRKYKAIYIKRANTGVSYVAMSTYSTYTQVFNLRIVMDHDGAFVIRKARGGFRYNVIALNGESITTSKVLKAKQSAIEMQEKHFRQYKLIDKS